MNTNLETYDNSWYKPGSILKRLLWYVVSIFFFKGSWNVMSSVKVFWLRVFGAQVGFGVVIRPHVEIKYPWKLIIGNHCWIGEHVWIDNLDQVVLGNHVCLSQGVFVLCGNHNYKSPSFDLMLGPVILKEGAWLGAKSIVGPGVTVGTHAVLSMGSVTSKDLNAYEIYRGNPAISVAIREIT
jgi:putative colanic acid biosynthesis acetyltransferase WcaF